MAVNDGIGNPIHNPFPGINIPDTTGAPGSAGNRTVTGAVPADGESGLPGVGTVAPYSGSTGTTQPGQSASSVIAPGPDDGYTDTGAGHGSTMTNEHGRRPWQQPGG